MSELGEYQVGLTWLARTMTKELLDQSTKFLVGPQAQRERVQDVSQARNMSKEGVFNRCSRTELRENNTLHCSKSMWPSISEPHPDSDSDLDFEF